MLKALIEAGSSKPAPPQHTDERQFDEISREEYESWLTPETMLEAMPYGMLNKTQLGRELRAERYRSAADEVIWAHDGFTGRDRLAILPRWVWTIAMPDVASDFWRTGYLDAWVPVNRSAFDAGNWIRIYGVRFWAPGLQLPEPKVSADSVAKPNVAKADLARWHEIFVDVHPNAPEALALQSAAAMFPNNTVPRQWVRDLRGPQKRGKPPSRHN